MTQKGQFLVAIILFIVSDRSTQGNWMYLSLNSVGSNKLVDCSLVSNLNKYHMQVCRSKPRVIRIVGLGMQLAVDECQRQFRRDRWNCPIMKADDSGTVFGNVLNRGTKEAAFIHAITSAGVAFSVTQACSAGMFPDCDKCDKSKKGHVDKSGQWKWGECNANVNEGLKFAEEFIDSTEKHIDRIRRSRKRHMRRTMNLHNNRAGRLALIDTMMTVCSCSGVSGSCALRVCHRITPPFKEVGARMKRLYKNAIKMSASRRGRKQILEAATSKVKQLLYLEKSPNFCFPNPEKGVMGTSGRVCNITSEGMENCSLLCCGQGYNIQIRRNVKRCNCRFRWCCNVDCDVCESLEKVHTCK